MKKRSLMWWLPPLLMLATALDIKADSGFVKMGFVNITICPWESTPTEEFTWAYQANDVTKIKAHSNGKVIECLWTPRPHKEKS